MFQALEKQSVKTSRKSLNSTLNRKRKSDEGIDESSKKSKTSHANLPSDKSSVKSGLKLLPAISRLKNDPAPRLAKQEKTDDSSYCNNSISTQDWIRICRESDEIENQRKSTSPQPNEQPKKKTSNRTSSGRSLSPNEQDEISEINAIIAQDTQSIDNIISPLPKRSVASRKSLRTLDNEISNINIPDAEESQMNFSILTEDILRDCEEIEREEQEKRRLTEFQNENISNPVAEQARSNSLSPHDLREIEEINAIIEQPTLLSQDISHDDTFISTKSNNYSINTQDLISDFREDLDQAEPQSLNQRPYESFSQKHTVYEVSESQSFVEEPADNRIQEVNSDPVLTQLNQLIVEDENVEIVRNSETNSQYMREKEDLHMSFASYTLSKRQAFYAARDPIKNLDVKEDGSFFGLGKKIKTRFLRNKGILQLYDWQKECLRLEAVEKRRNLVYALPTSGGKTLVSEILMLREVLLRKKNVMFILPYVSIVQEKVNDLLPLACEHDFFVEEYCAGKGKMPPTKRRLKNSIYVCTMEKANILIDSLIESNRIDEISMIVVDELHMIGDPHRGPVLELLLAKVMYLQKVPIQIVGMSATIANLNDIANFLYADIYTRDFRPVELQEYLRVGSDLYEVDHKATTKDQIFKLIHTNLHETTEDCIVKRDPDLISPCAYECITDNHSCLIFCSTKKNCESVALLLVDCFPDCVKETHASEREKIVASIKADANGSICPVLEKTIPYGIAYHHSGLTNDERKQIEDAYRQGFINIICCTSTLAAGVNLPAKRVIIRSPYIGREFMTLSKYKQMIGRAGRAGIVEAGESILFCIPKDLDAVKEMLTSQMDFTVSGFIEDSSGLMKTCITSLIGTRLCKTLNDLERFSSYLLAHVQEKSYKVDVKELFIESVKELLVEGTVEHKPNPKSKLGRKFSIEVKKEKLNVNFGDDLNINLLGQAAMKAGVSLEDAKSIEIDLKTAQRNLVLAQNLHLMYIVAPKEACDVINLNYRDYNYIYFKLNKSLQHTATIIGIDERVATKMITRPKFDAAQESVLKRFYVALILCELWHGRDVFSVSTTYKVDRGLVYKLMQMAATQAHTIFRFCEVIDRFWAFKEVFEKFSQRLSHCCSVDLLPLMELPYVKLGRAKQMYSMGIKTVCDVAGHSPQGLISKLGNLNTKQATIIVRAAQHAVSEQIDTYRMQMLDLAESVQTSRD